MEEDPDIAIIKARKMKQLREQAAAKGKVNNTNEKNAESNSNILRSYLYDRGDEVLKLAFDQFPQQTELLVNRIVDLIKLGEINSRISGGELLSIFRYAGLRIRLNTNINIHEHGKSISLADKLKQNE
jgi:DNA-binding TFAR19-related protein (PDSD5 family)